MRIDLAKIFPTGCREQGLKDTCIESTDIQHLFVDTEINPSVHVIQIGKVEYRFPAIDGGIAHISGIITTEQTLALYKDNTSAIETDQVLREKFVEASKKSIKFYTEKFGCNS
ncbi:MAG TPA: hypothetical protein VL098_08410 [Flavipsychrobacter sp.]|nr:hypothetical protein [Flavipsychrobacter sp.]